jgi:transketolase
MKDNDITQLKQSADYIRYLSLEAIERANSGHPGLPLGCADLGVLLYRYFLKFNPEQPTWANRDRFILSAGHGSMLLYSLLHSVGYNITLEDLENFRQLGSKTAGHPEYDLQDGIETTTGPLGQGFTNAVGCAIEGKMMAQRFNTKDATLFDYTVYTLMGDGCNMEGISYEAGSMAGHLGLDNLIAIYDSNNISIDGEMGITFTENVGKRYKALGWHVEYANSSDIKYVFDKLQKLKTVKGKPKLLILKTIIGQGLEKKINTNGIHGAPAGAEEIAYFIQNSAIGHLFEDKYGKDIVNDKEKLMDTIKQRLENKDPMLAFSAHTDYMKEGVKENKEQYNSWAATLESYKTNKSEKFDELNTYLDFKLPDTLRDKLLNYTLEKGAATRAVSGKVLNICAEELKQIVGGCADLVGSTKATVNSSQYITKNDFSGRNIAFGVREHAMGAIGNGLTLNKSMIAFTSTFFTFFDYMKPAVRLSALMQLRHLFVFTHDSIYVGEDGPTHQPIEHLNAMRLIPGIYAFRPGNDVETAFSYLYFLDKLRGPAAIIATRQGIPTEMFNMPNNKSRTDLYNDFCKGGYVFYQTDKDSKPDIILAGSGSELSLAMDTARMLEEKDQKNVRVVSIPCMELLNEADQRYKDELFLAEVKVVMIEAGSYRGVNLFFDKNVTLVNIDTFGVSAPGKAAAKHFGFTAEAVYQKI